MDLIGWAIVLFGPALCAAAGALTTWLALRGRYDRRADATWEAGYDTGYATAQVFSDSPADTYPTAVLHRPPPARHARPQPATEASRADAAVLLIRAKFAAIRARFDLPELGCLDGPRTAELHHVADAIGPPSGELLRAAGLAAGPSWPPAGLVG